jgi:hypothetical protein
MKVQLPVVLGVAALGIATTVVTSAPANAGPGIAQSASATLALPSVPETVLLTDCENGNCKNITSPAVAVQSLAIQVTYDLLNAASLPDVINYTGSPLVTLDACNGKTGVSLSITGSSVGVSQGKVLVNGQQLGDSQPVEGGANGYSRSICLPV